MLDFTSAAYLGLRHGADRLSAWPAIALSQPASLHEPPLLVQVGRAVARLQGAEDGVAGPSSLVLAMDALGPALPDAPCRVLVDAGCYPVLRWAAMQQGLRPLEVGHHAPLALMHTLRTVAPGMRPILATDGLCMGCGRTAPLGAYASIVAERGGFVLVDDTQALGLLGPVGAGTPAAGAPYGSLLRLASLSKAFNVPIAVLAGSRASIARFRDASASRLYCGPPSIPNALAAMRAVMLNARIGGRLRDALGRRIALFRTACAAFGVALGTGKLPVQTVVGAAGDAATLVARLAASGLRAFASRSFHDDTAQLRLIITVAHQPSELWLAARLLRDVLRTSVRNEGVPAHAAVL